MEILKTIIHSYRCYNNYFEKAEITYAPYGDITLAIYGDEDSSHRWEKVGRPIHIIEDIVEEYISMIENDPKKIYALCIEEEIKFYNYLISLRMGELDEMS